MKANVSKEKEEEQQQQYILYLRKEWKMKKKKKKQNGRAAKQAIGIQTFHRTIHNKPVHQS